MEVSEQAVGAMQAYLRLKRYILSSGIAREALQAAVPFLSVLDPSAAPCPCTKTQQDETCPVGYPSLLCEICDGKGVLQPSAAAFAIIDRPIVGIENRTPQEVHDILRDRIKHAPSAPSAARSQALEEAAKLLEREADELDGLVDSVSHHLRSIAKTIRALSSPDHADAGKVEGEASAAARDVLDERRRQIEAEGWTPEHDDTHTGGEMAFAAAAYVLGVSTLSGRSKDGRISLPWTYRIWPRAWGLKWWKPTNRRRNLVKAGAFIIAEIERLDRRSAPASEGAE